MSSIPFKALKLGALTPFKDPISYGKSKVSGSKHISYLMHSKSGIMPGQPNLFRLDNLKRPFLSTPLSTNRYIREFKLKQDKSIKQSKGVKYHKYFSKAFKFDEYCPHDDDAYQKTVLASYRQAFGNLNLMESERPVDLERRLRNGDLSVKEFIRCLLKSAIYKHNYFDNVNQIRAIELSFKNILGRPPMNQKEIVNSIDRVNQYGFENHVDHLIDSDEYSESFGEYTVPFQRCWNSPVGVWTSSFCNSAKLSQGFARSDNSLSSNSLLKATKGSLIFKNLVNEL